MLQLTNHMCDKIAWSLTKLMSISVPHAIFSHMLPCYNAISSYHFKYHVIMPRAISSLAEFFYIHTRTIGFQNYILPLFNLFGILRSFPITIVQLVKNGTLVFYFQTTIYCVFE